MKIIGQDKETETKLKKTHCSELPADTLNPLYSSSVETTNH